MGVSQQRYVQEIMRRAQARNERSKYQGSLISYLFPKKSYGPEYEALLARTGGLGEGIAIRPQVEPVQVRP
jgi:hypothetical protein